MFILIDPTARQELRRGDILIAYFEAPGDVCYESVCSVERDIVTGRPKNRPSVVKFLAPYVTNWSGVAARGTNEPVPWPGAEVAPGAVAPSDLALREGLLALLPWNVLLALDAAIARTWREGVESGKD